MAVPASPAKHTQELSIQRPSVSPLKRKRSSSSADRDAEPASPTSLDEVSSSAPEDGVISPKKKAKTADGELSKWESHILSSVASALDLDAIEADKRDEYEPIPFSAAPAAPLDADELQILRHFLA